MDYLKEIYRKFSENRNLLNSSKFVYQNAPKAETEQNRETPEAQLAAKKRQEAVDKAVAEAQEKLSKGVEVKMDDFEKKLKAIPGIKEDDIDSELKKIWNALPESSRDPLKSPEALKLARLKDDTIKKNLPKVTATEEKAKGWIESLKQRFSKFADIFPYIGAMFASMAEAQKKEGKQSFMTGLYEKMAGWFGHESPKVKFEKFKTDVKLPEGFAFGESSDTETAINKSDGEKIGTLKFDAESGRATLVTGLGTFSYKDVAELNQNLNNKLAAAPTQKPANPEQQETPEAKYTRLFKKAKSWDLDTANLTQDLQTLKDSGIEENKIEEEINTAALETSNLSKIYKAIKETLPTDKVYKMPLAHLRYKNLSDKIINQEIVAAIKSKKDKTPEQIRTFLDDAYAKKDDEAKRKTVMDTYKA